MSDQPKPTTGRCACGGTIYSGGLCERCILESLPPYQPKPTFVPPPTGAQLAWQENIALHTAAAKLAGADGIVVKPTGEWTADFIRSFAYIREGAAKAIADAHNAALDAAVHGARTKWDDDRIKGATRGALKVVEMLRRIKDLEQQLATEREKHRKEMGPQQSRNPNMTKDQIPQAIVRFTEGMKRTQAVFIGDGTRPLIREGQKVTALDLERVAHALNAEERRANDSIKENVRLMNQLAAEREHWNATWKRESQSLYDEIEDLRKQLSAERDKVQPLVDSLKDIRVGAPDIVKQQIKDALAKVGK